MKTGKVMSKLKRARVLADLSQTSLAEQSGVNVYRLQVCEYGWSMLRPDEAKKISKIVNCKPKELMEEI
jgi:ribosome-binding protein aMBF1 (putative translation factor)